MRLNRLVLLVILSMSLSGYSQKINPITQAMLDGYEKILQANPDDWFTLYERASQYYSLSRYDDALYDIKKSISLTPKKEKEQLCSAYSLAADIYLQLEEYNNALNNINNALAISPNSYSLLYTKGNILLYMNNPQEARGCFQAMQRIKSRSQEAVFGLAKCAVLQGDSQGARSYMAEAEKLDASNYITYCRIGDLYKDLNEPEYAAANYLSAFSLSSGSDRPITSLFSLAKTDYQSVMNAIDFALTKTNNIVPLYFIQGNIAKEYGHYQEAYEAYRHLIYNAQDEAGALSAPMAEICIAINSLDEALKYAQAAYTSEKSLKNILLLSETHYALGNYTEAAQYANEALAKDSDNEQAMLNKAKALIGLKDYISALDVLNEAILVNAEAVEPLMLKAYINSNALAGGVGGTKDFERVAKLSATNSKEQTYKAIAQSLMGKKLDADSTASSLISAADTNAEAAYYAALYFAQIGRIERGKQFLDKAEDLGFENDYLLKTDVTPMLSIAPLR